MILFFHLFRSFHSCVLLFFSSFGLHSQLAFINCVLTLIALLLPERHTMCVCSVHAFVCLYVRVKIGTHSMHRWIILLLLNCDQMCMCNNGDCRCRIPIRYTLSWSFWSLWFNNNFGGWRYTHLFNEMHWLDNFTFGFWMHSKRSHAVQF